MTITIRHLTPADAPLAATAIRTLKGPSLGESYLRTLLANPANILLLAAVDAAPAGFLYAHRLQRLRAEVDHLFIYEISVAEPHRRTGLGRALIDSLRRLAPAAECFVITERTNTRATTFYAATGAAAEAPDAIVFVYPPAAGDPSPLI